MRYVMVALLFMTSTFALAQEGGGHGPPLSIIVMPQPTTTLPTTPLSKLFQPKSRLTPMMK
jgi:hypothetical protein